MARPVRTIGQLISILSEYDPNIRVRVNRGRKLIDIGDIISVINIDNSKDSSICIWIKED